MSLKTFLNNLPLCMYVSGFLLGAVLQGSITATPLFVFLFVFGIGALAILSLLKWNDHDNDILFSKVNVTDMIHLMGAVFLTNITVIAGHYAGKVIRAIALGYADTGTCFLSAVLSELWLVFVSGLQAAYPAVLLALGLLAVFVAVVEASLRKK